MGGSAKRPKLNEEAARADCDSVNSARDFTHLDRSFLSGADERDVVLSIEFSAVHTRGGKQNWTFKYRVFYL